MLVLKVRGIGYCPAAHTEAGECEPRRGLLCAHGYRYHREVGGGAARVPPVRVARMDALRLLRGGACSSPTAPSSSLGAGVHLLSMANRVKFRALFCFRTY